MTNRDAINILEEVKILDDTMYAYNPSYLEALDMALTALEAEETWYATHEYPPKTRWIPCSERLPEDDERVLATTAWEDVTIAERVYPPINDTCWFIHDGSTNATIDDVVAWMPLPEPYKEGEQK